MRTSEPGSRSSSNTSRGSAELPAEEVEVWAAEQRELSERGDFFFACTQCCFAATKPNASRSAVPFSGRCGQEVADILLREELRGRRHPGDDPCEVVHRRLVPVHGCQDLLQLGRRWLE